MGITPVRVERSLAELREAPDSRRPWSVLSQSPHLTVASLCPHFIFKSLKILNILHSDGGVVSLSNSDTQREIVLDYLLSIDLK